MISDNNTSVEWVPCVRHGESNLWRHVSQDSGCECSFWLTSLVNGPLSPRIEVTTTAGIGSFCFLHEIGRGIGWSTLEELV